MTPWPKRDPLAREDQAHLGKHAAINFGQWWVLPPYMSLKPHVA